MKTLVNPRMKHRKVFGLSKKKRVLLLALGLSLYSGSALAAESDFQTSEYYFSNGLDVINAAAAYNKGYSGKGVALGVCDLPMNFAHPEFTSKKSAGGSPPRFPLFFLGRNTLGIRSISRPTASPTSKRRNFSAIPPSGRFSRTPMTPLWIRRRSTSCSAFGQDGAR